MLYGIAAIANSHVFVANAHYVIGDLRVWGWVTLIIAAVQLVAAGGVLMGNQLARWFAVAVVGLNAIDMMFFIPAYPFWALTIIAVDVVALWRCARTAAARTWTPSSTAVPVPVATGTGTARRRNREAQYRPGMHDGIRSILRRARAGLSQFRRVSGSPVTSASDTSVPACAPPGERHARKELLITAPAVR